MTRWIVLIVVIACVARAQPDAPIEDAPVEGATDSLPQPLPQAGGEQEEEQAPAQEQAPAPAPTQVIFRPGIWIFGEYRAQIPDGADWNHVFDLGRGWAWLGFELEGARARFLLEAVRGSGEGSLFGVGGDSLVLRVREAWAGYRFFDMLEIRAGLVPQLIGQALLNTWQLQSIALPALQRFDVMQPADLGANVRFDFPRGFGTVGVGLYNGEGYRSRELNRGKTLEIFAEAHPFAFIPEVRALTVFLGYQNGSEGTGAVRADRFFGGLAWIDPRWGAGATATWVGGFDRTDQDGALVELWLHGRPWEGLVLAGRFVHFIRDLAQGSDALTELTLAAGYRLLEAISGYFAVDGRFAGDAARAALPGYQEWRLRVIAEARFEGDVRWTP